MTQFLPFLIVGITAGSAYALAGVGLVLTFRTSGIFNFAYGALATLAAYVFYTLHVTHGVSWPVAALVAVGVLGPVLGIAFEGFGRGLSRVGMAWRVAATVGILVSIEAACSLIYGTTTLTFPDFLPTTSFQIGGVYVTYEQVIITLISVSTCGALYLFLRTTRVGMAMRAVVDDPDLVALAGRSPARIRRLAWIIGCVFATLSGLLLAPSVGLDPTTLTLLVVQAFGAAAIGRFVSLPITWLGGLAIGIGESFLTKLGTAGPILSGLAPSLPFLVLFLILVAARRGQLHVREVAIAPRVRSWRSPTSFQILVAILTLGFLAAVPAFVGYRISGWTLMLTDVIIFLSLGLLVRVAGQVSLCQISFAAIGAAAFSKLAVDAGIPWLLAILIASLVAVPVGALIAIPAMRFSGLYLALATLGFGYLLQDMFYSSPLMFGFGSAGLPMPSPDLAWLHLDPATGLYYVVLVFAVAASALMVLLTHSRLGRLLRGTAESPVAMTGSGVSPRITVVIVFCVAAFVAAVGGALNGVVLSVASGANFDPFTSLVYLAVVLIVVGSEPWYALIAGASVALIPLYLPSSDTTYYLQLLFGVSAVLVALVGQPELAGVTRMRGMIDGVDRKIRERFGRVTLDSADDGRRVALALAVDESTDVEVVRNGGSERVLLTVDDLSVRFGGLIAVNGVSLRAEMGCITGLIGPNGAGKTTVINACSGAVTAETGALKLNGIDMAGMSPDRRARMGLGRTFQRMQLCEALSVWENVALGSEGRLAGVSVLRQMLQRRGDPALIRARVRSALDACGLTDLADAQVGTLPNGQRRLVEIARCLAGTFDLLLLDEPSSGLDDVETRRVGELLCRVVAEGNVGVLLVEHDMSLVMSVCQTIYVMDFGKLLFCGNPEQTRRDGRVQAAYLGADPTPIEVGP